MLVEWGSGRGEGLNRGTLKGVLLSFPKLIYENAESIKQCMHI